jgi:hypothetical protein
MNLGFIILAHNHPEAVRRLANILATDGDLVVIHFDSSASPADLLAVQQIAAERPDQIRVISKIHCVWGEWSLVDAVLLALQEFKKMPSPPDYVHLMSGADYPIRPIADLKEFLRIYPNQDFIECCDISQKSWIKGGLEKERFLFYFPFNFRTHRKTFDRLVRWHRKLKIRRRMPLGLKPHMGSQWWTLRWPTCERVLNFTASNPTVPKFFKTTWIPDESYFQTLIAALVPKNEIANLQLIFHHLTSSGRPYVFYNDHLSIIRRLPHFFIRKVSPGASTLLECLGKPGFYSRRIPTQKLLHKVRELLRARIDENHRFTVSVPSHLHDFYASELKTIERPVITIFVTDPKQLQAIEQMASTHPAYCWLGRPFAPKSISIPENLLARMGMSRNSWKIRDYFRQQFLHSLITATDESQVPIIAVLVAEDNPDLPALNLLKLLVPFFVKGNSLESLVSFSAFGSAVESDNATFLSRMHFVDLNQILKILETRQDLSSSGQTTSPSPVTKPHKSALPV